jgi:agmatinase
MQVAYETLLSRPVKTPSKDIPSGLKTGTISKDGVDHPRIVTLGGDHTVVRNCRL